MHACMLVHQSRKAPTAPIRTYPQSRELCGRGCGCGQRKRGQDPESESGNWRSCIGCMQPALLPASASASLQYLCQPKGPKGGRGGRVPSLLSRSGRQRQGQRQRKLNVAVGSQSVGQCVPHKKGVGKERKAGALALETLYWPVPRSNECCTVQYCNIVSYCNAHQALAHTARAHTVQYCTSLLPYRVKPK